MSVSYPRAQYKINKMKSKWWLMSLPVVAVPLILSGCGAKKPVATVDEDDSGIEAQEIEVEPVESGAEDIKTPAVQSAKDTVNWAGVYKGTFPCASCEGIKKEITLNTDGTYVEKETYISNKPGGGEIDVDKGVFTWDATGTKITLVENDDVKDADWDDKETYLVSEGQIQALDSDGNVITGELASKYILKKQ